MEFDLNKINEYLIQFGIEPIESNNILLEWALSILEVKFKNCEILNIDLALACIIDILTKIKQNEITGRGKATSKSEKIGSAQLEVSTADVFGKVEPEWLSYKILKDVALKCHNNVFVGVSGYTSLKGCNGCGGVCG